MRILPFHQIPVRQPEGGIQRDEGILRRHIQRSVPLQRPVHGEHGGLRRRADAVGAGGRLAGRAGAPRAARRRAGAPHALAPTPRSPHLPRPGLRRTRLNRREEALFFNIPATGYPW